LRERRLLPVTAGGGVSDLGSEVAEVELPIRSGTPEDWQIVAGLLSTVYHSVFDSDSAQVGAEIFEPERALLATDEGTLVAHAAAFTRDLTVPGNVVPAAHVTMVGVLPTHRRRRLLSRMMQRQLREVQQTGREPIAVLWASESPIYPRFGYGLAARRLILEIDNRDARLPARLPGQPGGTTPATDERRLRPGRPAELHAEFAKVYEQVRPDRPGWSSREGSWWRDVLADFPSRRDGATELHAVLHESRVPTDGVSPGGYELDGYAIWRTKGSWESARPNGETWVSEVVAANPAAYLALWRFLLDIDLTRVTRFSHASVDEPLLQLAVEPRALRPTLADALWVRIVDLPGALTARQYASAVDVVFEVTDALLPANAGRWRLTTGGGVGTCVRTDMPADLACDVTDLGAAYLGGTPLGALAAAGRVRELRPGAVAAASAAFGWHRAPVSIEVF
jgi:predicted acetyltransferase